MLLYAKTSVWWLVHIWAIYINGTVLLLHDKSSWTHNHTICQVWVIDRLEVFFIDHVSSLTHVLLNTRQLLLDLLGPILNFCRSFICNLKGVNFLVDDWLRMVLSLRTHNGCPNWVIGCSSRLAFCTPIRVSWAIEIAASCQMTQSFSFRGLWRVIQLYIEACRSCIQSCLLNSDLVRRFLIHFYIFIFNLMID